LIAADTSLVVALFASWHEAHDAAREALPGEVRLPAHVLIESYSVLTRLPPPHRALPMRFRHSSEHASHLNS
jgi:hypothetical protein